MGVSSMLFDSMPHAWPSGRQARRAALIRDAHLASHCRVLHHWRLESDAHGKVGDAVRTWHCPEV